MKNISQNPYLKVWGVAFFAIGLILSWQFGIGMGSLANIIGILLISTGTDTKLIKGGIKLGFSSILQQDLENAYKNGDGEIVLVAQGHRRFRVKRWHYRSTEWQIIQNHIANLTEEAESGRRRVLSPAPHITSHTDLPKGSAD